MELLLKYSLYFGAGLLVATISTFTVKSIAKDRAIHASISAFVSMFVSMYIILDIITNLQNVGFVGIALYALGDAIGTYAVTNKKTPQVRGSEKISRTHRASRRR